MIQKKYLFIFLSLDIIFLLFYTGSISISGSEANFLYFGDSIFKYIIEYFLSSFGTNDLVLRLPSIILYTLSVILMYIYSKKILAKDLDALISTTIFALLPGINSAALAVDNAIMVIFLTLVFLILFDKNKTLGLLFLLPLAIIDQAFIIFFISITCYFFYKRDYKILTITISLLALNYYIFGFDFNGRPRGHFADIFAIYSGIFSPLIFAYFIYSMYWFLIKHNKPLPILWFLSFISFIVSIILSLRQNISIEDFAPFTVLSIPLLVKLFLNSMRVKLPEYRTKSYILAGIILISLLFLTSLTFFNKPLYLVMENPKKHFAYPNHFLKEVAEELKKIGIHSVDSDSQKFLLRLKFYGIDSNGKYFLTDEENREKIADFIISPYKNINFYLYKI